MPNTIERTTIITRKMAPNTYAPASLGFAIVFLTVAILPCFALVGFGIYKVRSWMAFCRPVDVEAAIKQTPKDDYKGITINSSTGAEPTPAARPESLVVVEPLKESPSDIEVNVFPQNTSAPAPSSSFEIWANKLFTKKDEFADEGCSLSSSQWWRVSHRNDLPMTFMPSTAILHHASAISSLVPTETEYRRLSVIASIISEV